VERKPTRWRCEPYEVAASVRLADELGVSPTLATILTRRGLQTGDAARDFLAAGVRHDPSSLPGVPQACETILRHVARRSRIVVFGDYDVDGVCSTAILVRALRELGAEPAWELPSRSGDGYGLTIPAVERLAGQGAGLLVTVDTGVTAVAEVAAAKAAGLEVIVTDHHRPGEVLPDCTIVHPALGSYGTPELCASGVALKLSESLMEGAGLDPAGAERDLDLAALATVCDVVPLRGENRRIVREGLARLRRPDKVGLRALMAVAAVEPAEVDERTLGFRLGPRINAAGRMERADAALELLLTDDGARAEQVAQELDGLNADRRQAEQRILFAAEAACAEQASAGAFVVAGEGWHPGVVGIVASRLVERWRRPCVAIALDGDAGRGSGRSIAAYDLHAGLSACAGHLRRFGGHRVAAGLELDAREVAGFRSALARHAGAALSPDDLIPLERVDAVVPGGALGLPLAEELDRLRPFGAGNPQPTLLVPAARLEGVTGMGEKREHARFTLVTGAARSRGVAFGSPPRALTAVGQDHHDLALRLEPNRWNGTVEPRVVLRAVCPSRPGSLRVLAREESFWAGVERELGAEPGTWPAQATARRALSDRRGEGIAGIAGDLLTSGESVLVGVADVARRRASLELLVAGLAPGDLAVAAWAELAADPRLAAPFTHVIAFDPPPAIEIEATVAGLSGPAGGLAVLAWGPAEVGFALAVCRFELDLRQSLVEAYRALRDAGTLAGGALERALRGGGRYPRSARCGGRVLRILTELGLAEYSAGPTPSCRLRGSAPTQLERSPTYRSCVGRLAELERALEVPAVSPPIERGGRTSAMPASAAR
jgi:single-stranded-DNA-specific exonuclease